LFCLSLRSNPCWDGEVRGQEPSGSVERRGCFVDDRVIAITCTSAGRRHSCRVIMATVLPINAPGLVSGSTPCTIRVNDGPGPWS
jgi:hypothetical protein